MSSQEVLQSKEAALQQQYIELLEKRIAQLEVAVKAPVVSTLPDVSKDAPEGAPKNGLDRAKDIDKNEVRNTRFSLDLQAADISDTIRRRMKRKRKRALAIVTS